MIVVSGGSTDGCCTGLAASHGTFRGINDTTGTILGSGVFKCNDGTWEEQSGSTCLARRRSCGFLITGAFEGGHCM